MDGLLNTQISNQWANLNCINNPMTISLLMVISVVGFGVEVGMFGVGQKIRSIISCGVQRGEG